MKQTIKNYLEDAIRTDQALAAKYDETKIDACVKYINNIVREEYIKKNGEKNGGCHVAPEVIFKMARDFFIDGETARTDNLSEDLEVLEATEKQKKPTKTVDVEAIKRQAVADYKAKEKEKAEAKKKAEAERKAAEVAPNPNQVDLFG